jgi:hypothetical protein
MKIFGFTQPANMLKEVFMKGADIVLVWRGLVKETMQICRLSTFIYLGHDLLLNCLKAESLLIPIFFHKKQSTLTLSIRLVTWCSTSS